jgi:hypothetical protein
VYVEYIYKEGDTQPPRIKIGIAMSNEPPSGGYVRLMYIYGLMTYRAF